MSSSSSTACPAPPPTSNATFRHLLASVVSQLTSSSHKGQNGRLTVIGGSAAYTGAPYFSSLTTLNLDADLVTVLTSVEAAVPIKTYSPELMVRPTLVPHYLLDVDGVHPAAGKGKGAHRQEAIRAEVDSVRKEVLESSNVMIVGPGLGKDELIVDTVAELLTACRSLQVPVVLDGDGINIAVSHPDVIRGNTRLIATPNAAVHPPVGRVPARRGRAWHVSARRRARRRRGHEWSHNGEEGTIDVDSNGSASCIAVDMAHRGCVAGRAT